MANHSDLPPDIQERITAEYAPERHTAVYESLEPLSELSSRVVRCVLYLAGADLDRLRYYVACALTDWRDVIWWAEYEGHDPTGRGPSRHLRDFNLPFPRADLPADGVRTEVGRRDRT